MKLGIVGLPNVGKSTLFNSITKAGAECANYPFCTIEPNVGVVPIPDKRLIELTKLYNSEKTTYATIEFVDIAGLVKGASKGEGLGNQFLANIRETDAIVHVVRCFDDSNIIHVDGTVDPIRDIDVINMELIFADLETLEKRLSKVKHLMNNDKEAKVEFEVLEKLKSHLESGKLAINFETDDDKKFVDELNLLTSKKVIFALNVGEEDVKDDGANNEYVKKAKEYAKTHNSEAFVISAKVEEDLAGLDDSEKEEFLKELGIKESGLDKLIKASYKLLNLMSFLTAGEKESRAWTIEIGTKAPKAAGKIHTDFEKGFIKAEVINYKDLLQCGSLAKAKEKGLVRIEGKDYVVQDGDVMLFRFNV
ncbi:MAG: redox-regulated ATPase YchF [Lachnospiraceae bacterium]|nr:redox-regulated ATPase YchF [Lachnospiraceae bacterium]